MPLTNAEQRPNHPSRISNRRHVALPLAAYELAENPCTR